MRTPEGTPKKTGKPDKFLRRAEHKTVGFQLLPQKQVSFMNCKEHPMIHSMRFSATIFRQVNPVVSNENPFGRSKSGFQTPNLATCYRLIGM